MKVEIEIGCCLCTLRYKTVIELPHEWAMRYKTVSQNGGFCPQHSVIAKWAHAQCPGCVGGWQECDLWSAFAYSSRELTESDFAQIRQGICPKRTNGTMMFSRQTGIQSMNLSEKAGTTEGEAFVKAIKDYWEKYSRK